MHLSIEATVKRHRDGFRQVDSLLFERKFRWKSSGARHPRRHLWSDQEERGGTIPRAVRFFGSCGRLLSFDVALDWSPGGTPAVKTIGGLLRRPGGEPAVIKHIHRAREV